jgi:hypothetical protein
MCGKALAFPVAVAEISGGCAARAEAQPQPRLCLTERHSLSAYQRAEPVKLILRNISYQDVFRINLPT